MRETISGGALTETTLFILLSTYEQAIHGYGMMQFIDNASNGRLSVGPGTLYGGITHLQKKEWIECVEQMKGSSKKLFRITDLGKTIVQTEKIRMQNMVSLTEKVQGGEIYDKV